MDFHCESRGCPPFGASAPSALFLLVVPSNIMPGWCFHSATIPLWGFLPLHGVGWWYVGARMCFQRWLHQHRRGDRCFRWALVCAPPATSSPLSVGQTLRWRVITERRSYERWCGGAMVAVYPTSMLFGGGSNRCSVAISLAGILVFSWSVQVILPDLGGHMC